MFIFHWVTSKRYWQQPGKHINQTKNSISGFSPLPVSHTYVHEVTLSLTFCFVKHEQGSKFLKEQNIVVLKNSIFAISLIHKSRSLLGIGMSGNKGLWWASAPVAITHFGQETWICSIKTWCSKTDLTYRVIWGFINCLWSLVDPSIKNVFSASQCFSACICLASGFLMRSFSHSNPILWIFLIYKLCLFLFNTAKNTIKNFRLFPVCHQIGNILQGKSNTC